MHAIPNPQESLLPLRPGLAWSRRSRYGFENAKRKVWKAMGALAWRALCVVKSHRKCCFLRALRSLAALRIPKAFTLYTRKGPALSILKALTVELV